jgi:RsiW-degrading membrane proteinase PrsW (M82 family)
MIWFFYFWRIDVFDQEPVLPGLLAILGGLIMALFSTPVLDYLNLVTPFQPAGGILQSLFYSVVMVALPEELLKFIPVIFIIFLSRQVNEPVDLIIYGSLTALGFATLENVMLISEYGLGVMVARLLIATIMHMVSTTVLCFAWAYARFIKPGKLVWFITLGWLAAALVHGLFNYFVLSGDHGVSALSLLVLVLSVWGYSLMLRNALNFSPFFSSPQTKSSRLVNYEWILTAALWLLAMGYLYIHIVYATSAANGWLLTNIWTAIPIVLGLFAALGELGLKKDTFSFP